MQNKLTIITINFNNKFGLEKTIQSVVNQSYSDFEYIIIDGKSTDGSIEIIEKYQNKISYAISEKDTGIYNAMNKGIKVANGEFLLFMNSGDTLIDNFILSKVVKDLDSKIGIFYGNMIFSIDGKPTMNCNLPNKLAFSFFLNFSLPHQATFIKKQLFNEHFYYNESLKILSDWEFCIYCICKMNVLYKHLNYTISNFDGSGVSSNSKNTNIIIEEKNQVIEKYFPLFYDDSKLLIESKSRRFQQILLLKQNKTKWKFLKLFINILTIFNKKNPTEFSKIYSKIK